MLHSLTRNENFCEVIYVLFSKFEIYHMFMALHVSSQQTFIKPGYLRDTQDYCTDSECLTDGGPTAIATNSILLWTMLWGFLALVLFFLRPNSMRGNSQGLGKPGPSNDRNVSLVFVDLNLC
ncbi:unnamed protein product [Strongylus vulgaris]|uniref:Small integral membrane protein 14 n=1 Tax=Strongylus vulgaris TaxID=40348 RepID=A0A3P7JRU3_STRVU|nr:unnamed protein product [Strongylus vulgaris]